jgi:uncharacterized FAD-dependent dehydrogenase
MYNEKSQSSYYIIFFKKNSNNKMKKKTKVPTSVDENELCVNGMSFSKRQSKFANSALVVTVSPSDVEFFFEKKVVDKNIEKNHNSDDSGHDVEFKNKNNKALRVMEFQKKMEKKAAQMGGGNFVVPVQRMKNFLNNNHFSIDDDENNSNSNSKNNNVSDSNNANIDVETSKINESEYDESTRNITTIIKKNNKIISSYRLGVKEAPLHELYPEFITKSLKLAIYEFEKKMPGFICDGFYFPFIIIIYK